MRAGFPVVDLGVAELEIGQRVVSPFACDGVGAVQHAAMRHNAAAHASAEDHAEHDIRAGRGAIGGLGQGKAVGVVGKANFPAQSGLHVLLERPADEAGGIAVFHQAAGAG